MPLLRRLCIAAVAALSLCTAAAAATGGAQFQPNPADQTWTGSINLSSQDLGAGWRGEGLAGGLTGDDTGASSSCDTPDMSDLVLTGGMYSPSFYRNDGAFVGTAAVAWQTPDQAQADWSRSFQPAIMGCLAADLKAESTKKLKVTIAGRKELAWPTFGERSVVYRISLVLKSRVKVRRKWRNISARATADVIAVGVGRARAIIWTFSLDAHPLSDFDQQKWAMLMAQRMTTPPA